MGEIVEDENRFVETIEAESIQQALQNASKKLGGEVIAAVYSNKDLPMIQVTHEGRSNLNRNFSLYYLDGPKFHLRSSLKR